MKSNYLIQEHQKISHQIKLDYNNVGDLLFKKAKENPNKTYNEIEKMRQEDLSYESSGEVVIDDTGECESCQ